MLAPWTPLTHNGSIRPEILDVVEVLRRAGLVGANPGRNMTLAELHTLGQAEWATGPRKERADLAPLGQHLEGLIWGAFTDLGFTEPHYPSRPRYNALFGTWGGAAACYDKLGFAAECAVAGVDFGAFVSLAGDRELKHGKGSELDSDLKLLHPESRYGSLGLISHLGAAELVYEADMIQWMWRRLELPRELWSLSFWQATPSELHQAGVMRATALQALGFWPGRLTAFGPYAELGKGPHRPFQANEMADALGPNATVEWIGSGVEPGWVPNSVAQLFDALARATKTYIDFEIRQGRNPLA